MSEEQEKKAKTCPLKTLGYFAAPEGTIFGEDAIACKSTCAWWDERNDSCAVMHLGNIASSVWEGLNHGRGF